MNNLNSVSYSNNFYKKPMSNRFKIKSTSQNIKNTNFNTSSIPSFKGNFVVSAGLNIEECLVSRGIKNRALNKYMHYLDKIKEIVIKEVHPDDTVELAKNDAGHFCLKYVAGENSSAGDFINHAFVLLSKNKLFDYSKDSLAIPITKKYNYLPLPSLNNLRKIYVKNVETMRKSFLNFEKLRKPCKNISFKFVKYSKEGFFNVMHDINHSFKTSEGFDMLKKLSYDFTEKYSKGLNEVKNDLDAILPKGDSVEIINRDAWKFLFCEPIEVRYKPGMNSQFNGIKEPLSFYIDPRNQNPQNIQKEIVKHIENCISKK